MNGTRILRKSTQGTLRGGAAVTKACLEHERAELKACLSQIHTLAGAPLRVANLTNAELLALLAHIRTLAAGPALGA